MELPIKFPSDADVIAEEAARFRALSPAQKVATVRSVYAAGLRLLRASDRADFARQYNLEQEELASRAFREVVARHAERT
jgi:hypothetical protein